MDNKTIMGIAGFFRIKVVNPNGSVSFDTGLVRNTITVDGIHLMLMALTRVDASLTPEFSFGGGTSGGVGYPYAIGIGEGANAPLQDCYLLKELNSEVTDDAYARALITNVDANNFVTDFTAGAGRGNDSTVTMAGTIAAGFNGLVTTQVNEIGLFDTNCSGPDCQSVGKLIAMTTFADTPVLATQALAVSYSLILTQP